MRIHKWKAALLAFALVASQVAVASAENGQQRRAEFHSRPMQQHARNFSPRVSSDRVTVQSVQRTAPQRWTGGRWNGNSNRTNFNRTIIRERFNNNVNYNAPRRWSGSWNRYRYRDRDFGAGLLVFGLGGLFYPTGVSYYGAPPYNAPCFNDFYGFYGYFHDGYCYREPGY